MVLSGKIFTTEHGSDMHPDTPTKILDQVIKIYTYAINMCKKYIKLHIFLKNV